MSKTFQLAVLASLAALTEVVESSPMALASGQSRKMRAALAEVEAALAEGGEPTAEPTPRLPRAGKAATPPAAAAAD